jgi:hypothetical protein
MREIQELSIDQAAIGEILLITINMNNKAGQITLSFTNPTTGKSLVTAPFDVNCSTSDFYDAIAPYYTNNYDADIEVSVTYLDASNHVVASIALATF